MPPSDNATPAPTKSGMKSTEQCVPLDALSRPDDQEQMQTPEVGDAVSYTVDGKITRVEGGNAYVQPSAVNGNDVSAGDSEQPADAEGDLSSAANAMDAQGTYA